MEASANGYTDAVLVLVEAGADLNIKDKVMRRPGPSTTPLTHTNDAHHDHHHYHHRHHPNPHSVPLLCRMARRP